MISDSATSATAETTGGPSSGDVFTITAHFVREDAPRGIAYFVHPERWEARKEHYDEKATVEVPVEELPSGYGPPGDEMDYTTLALEHAFRLLQNGVSVGKGRITEESPKRRSLSVGDVLILEGTPHEVTRTGFRDITERKEVDTGTQTSDINIRHEISGAEKTRQ